MFDFIKKLYKWKKNIKNEEWKNIINKKWEILNKQQINKNHNFSEWYNLTYIKWKW